MTRPERIALAAILVLAAAVRLIATFVVGTDPMTPDSPYYLAQASGLLEEHPVPGFPNGYPIFLSLIKAVVPGSSFLSAVFLVQIALSLATVYLVARIGLRLFPERPRAALVAAALVALHPHQFHYPRLIMSECLATFLVTLALFLLVEAFRFARTADTRVLQAAFGGMALGVATQTRSSVSLTMGVILVAALFLKGSRRAILGMLIGFIVAWGFFAGLEKVGILRPENVFQNNVMISFQSDSRSIGYIVHDREQRKRAVPLYLEFARRQPGTFLQQRAISLWQLWGPWSLAGGESEERKATLRLVALVRTVLLAGALSALWLGRRRLEVWILFAPILAVTIVHTAAFSNHRFTAPVEPAAILLSVAAVVAWRTRKAARVVDSRV
jgi:hypothetical protein